MKRRDTTEFSPTTTGRGLAYGLREEFGSSSELGMVSVSDLAGLIDAPRFCAAGACHEGDSGAVYVTTFWRGCL